MNSTIFNAVLRLINNINDRGLLKYMNYLYSISFLFLLLATGSCNMINPSDPVPTYVRIDSFSFYGNETVTGSNSHNINCVYVYLNNQSIGIFDLPVTVPVILNQPGKILVTPGIHFNGIGAFPGQYTFYLSDTFSISPAPGQTIRPVVKTTYFPQTKLRYYVDFDGSISGVANPFVKLTGDTGIARTAIPSEVFEGIHSGIISLPDGKDSSTITNSDPFVLPHNQDVFLEMNYKCNIPLTVGVSTEIDGASYSAYQVGFYPNEKWTKVYINLRTFASSYQGDKYKLLFRAIKDKTGYGYVLLDNLKIVSF